MQYVKLRTKADLTNIGSLEEPVHVILPKDARVSCSSFSLNVNHIGFGSFDLLFYFVSSISDKKFILGAKNIPECNIINFKSSVDFDITFSNKFQLLENGLNLMSHKVGNGDIRTEIEFKNNIDRDTYLKKLFLSLTEYYNLLIEKEV